MGAGVIIALLANMTSILQFFGVRPQSAPTLAPNSNVAVSAESPSLPSTTRLATSSSSIPSTIGETRTTYTSEPSQPKTLPANNIQSYSLARLPTAATEKEGRPGGCTGGCTGFRAGSGRIAGVVYPSSYLMGVAGNGRRSTAVWNSSASCTSLVGTFGLEDSSSASATLTLTISIDGGAARAIGTTTRAKPLAVSHSLIGVGQFELAVYVSGPSVSGEPQALLGDFYISCRSGSLGTL